VLEKSTVIQDRGHALPSFMKRLYLRPFACLSVLICILSTPAGRADPVSAVQLLRVSGCAGALPAMRPLQHNVRLDRAAALWSAGGSPLTAAARSGYQAGAAVGLRLRGSDDAIMRSLRQTRCRAVAPESLRDIGVFRSGAQYWLVLASAGTAVPAPPQLLADRAQTSTVALRVLDKVNAVRARGTRCGDRSLGPAPPLQLSGTLGSVATGHAVDMAQHDYFEHVDLSGHSPADRVRASGYRYQLVGENIAYGPATADEVVAGWLHSPGHCQNIMDPRFVEMGLAYAPGQGTRRGLYWDQELATPAK
jgi:uncharacterized protein YkwD